MKINITFFKPFFIFALFAFILFCFSIVAKPYTKKQKNVQYEYAAIILDEYLKINLQEQNCDYMYRDDLSTFIRKKNLSDKTESIVGKFVYEIIKEKRLIIEWHLSENKIIIDQIEVSLSSNNEEF